MRTQISHSILAAVLAIALTLSGCTLALGQGGGAATPTPTLIALLFTPTPITVPTAVSTPSAIPPTATPSPTATPLPTPTLIPRPTGDPVLVLGTPDDTDQFDNANNWTTFPESDNPCFWSEVREGRLWMTAKGQVGLSCWELTVPLLKDFYIEFKVQMPDPCDLSDRFGLVFRVPQNDKAYLYGITCGGVQTFTAWTGEETLQILPAAESNLVQTAPGSINRIGVMAEGDAFAFYINGAKVTEGSDQTFQDEGRIGFYVNAGTSTGFTVGFDDLAYWTLPRPTPTP